MASHRAALRNEEDGLGWGGLVPTKEERRIESLERKLKVAEEALQQFAECDLHDGNCASLEIATRRIRNIARAALAAILEK